MPTIRSIIETNIRLRREHGPAITLLAVCPNSEAVLAAGVKTAVSNNSVMLFAATLNQVDRDGGYTGWTPEQFVGKLSNYAEKYSCRGGLFPCLDHGGPWLKDKDTSDHLTFGETFQNVKGSIEACIRAGYSLLHIDPTVDRSLPPGRTLSIETVVERSVELIAFAEGVRRQLAKPEVSYEVGTEEVHGGMVDHDQFQKFVSLLRARMEKEGLLEAWPAFFVAQVGTDLHTTKFDPEAAAKIYEVLAPKGSLAKGHYSDWVENPSAYPASGMGGANVGPEFTVEEYNGLIELEAAEKDILKTQSGRNASCFADVVMEAVLRSNRWRKWLLKDETDKEFRELDKKRQLWLIQTGTRYIWTDPAVQDARQTLYKNVAGSIPDPDEFIVDRIKRSMEKYIISFNLQNSLNRYS